MDKGDVEVIMVKIDIISGFLGAGKTTLIKKLLQDAFKGQQVVLIENEFGEIGIDGGFLKDAGIEIKEMNSGCICCSLVGDFGTALKEVVEKYHPDRIVIEPSGVGKLSDVIHAVENLHLEADGEVKLNSAVTVVDVLKCKMYLKNFGEFFKNQVEAAGTIILSRTDTKKATPEKIEAAIELIRELNPDATIITTPVEDLGGQKILDTIEGMKIDLSHVEEEHDHCCDHEHHHDHDHEEHEHHHDHEDHDHDEHEHHHDHDHEGHHHHHHHADEAAMTTIMKSMSIITTMIMTIMSITMTMERAAPVAAMTMTTRDIIITIITQMRYLQAGVRKPSVNTAVKRLKRF